MSGGIPFIYTILLITISCIFTILLILLLSNKYSFVADPLFFFEKLKLLLCILGQMFLIAYMSKGDIFYNLKLVPQLPEVPGLLTYLYENIPFLDLTIELVCIFLFIGLIILLPISHTVIKYPENIIDENGTEIVTYSHVFLYDTLYKGTSTIFSFTLALFLIRLVYQYVFNEEDSILSIKNDVSVKMSGIYFSIV